MTRAGVLRDLVTNGRNQDPVRLRELAAELDLLESDLLVIAGHPVPAHLLPPVRDPDVFADFTRRVTYCDHAELASLTDFVLSLAPPSPASTFEPPHEVDATPPAGDRFPKILDGLMRNRGLSSREVPFTGLSRSTINGMLSGRWHGLQQLKAMGGPLGWRLEDLAAVAGETLENFNDCSTLCYRVGRVYMAAIPLTTEQLGQAAVEADRLSGRKDRDGLTRVSETLHNCPDARGWRPASR